MYKRQAQTAGSGKRFWFPATTPICPNMARVTADKILACLRDGTGEVSLPGDDVAAGSAHALDLMLDSVSYTHLDVYKRQAHG